MADFRATATYQRARDYWLARLPALPPAPRLPLARPIVPATVPRIVKREVRGLAPEPWAALKGRAGRLGISPTGLLVAAFAEALRPRCAEPSFSIGMGGSNRPEIHPEIQRVVGSFTTLHVLALEDAPGPFADRAQGVQRRLVADVDHQHFAGHHVLRELNRLRGNGVHASLPIHFNSVVEYGRRAAVAEEEPEADGAPPRVRLELTEVDLMISLPQVLLLWVALEAPDGGLELVSQAVEEVFPDGLVPELLDAYRAFLERLAAEDAAWREERPAGAAPEIVGEWLVPAPPEASAPPREPAEWDAEESALADLWEAELGRRPASSADDFFALGGDSLLAVRLLGRMRERWGGALPAAELFVHPDLAGQAAAVRRGLPRSSASLLRKLTGWARRAPGASTTRSST